MQILWTEGARRNLDSIEEYIARDNPRAAVKTVLRIVKKVKEQLDAYPESGKAGRITGTRELVCPGLPYIVIYAVNRDNVIVLRIFHTARKLE